MTVEKNYILALNVGSTSVKSRVFLFKRGEVKEVFSWQKGKLDPKKGHGEALEELRKVLTKKGFLEQVVAVGHRVVHGGSLKRSTKIGKKEMEIIKKHEELAPLHNPYNLEGIKTVAKWWKKPIPHVAVFDTAFYANLPEYASNYAIPRSLTAKYKLYRYGFHGTSHHYAMLMASKTLKKPVQRLRLITIHLGGGSSITAIRKGVAVDTSMGFTPLEGLVMGTRSGDLDPGIIFYLVDKAKMSFGELKNILVNKSGIYGLSGAGNMLDLLKKVRNKDPKALLALNIFAYRVQKYIGAYAAVLGGCDGMVFTGAVGAGDRLIRNKIVQPLKSSILSGTPVLVVESNEEKMIALETQKLLDI